MGGLIQQILYINIFTIEQALFTFLLIKTSIQYALKTLQPVWTTGFQYSGCVWNINDAVFELNTFSYQKNMIQWKYTPKNIMIVHHVQPYVFWL